ncbi:hypothetical protein ACOMHN_036937 [Nucella lapillus]
MSRIVCKEAFLFLLGISRNLLTRLSKHYQTEGLAQPSKKSGGRRSNTRSLKYQDTEAVKKFICHYAEDHAVSLPGRVPGFKREDIRLLPSAIPKSGIYRQYADHANQAGLRVVGASTFRQLWLELCPYIVVAKPMTDLCWRCQRNNGRIFRGTFITDEEKNELILEQQRHLSQVNGERQLYQQMTAEAKEVVQQHGLQRLQREENQTMYDVVAVLGSSTSDQSITATWLMGRSQVPMVSVLATSDDLNNPKRFPYFLRVVPPDRHQFRAIAELIKTFAWTYVSVVYEESNYGENAFRLLREYLEANSTCLAVADKIGREAEEKPNANPNSDQNRAAFDQNSAKCPDYGQIEPNGDQMSTRIGTNMVECAEYDTESPELSESGPRIIRMGPEFE